MDNVPAKPLLQLKYIRRNNTKSHVLPIASPLTQPSQIETPRSCKVLAHYLKKRKK